MHGYIQVKTRPIIIANGTFRFIISKKPTTNIYCFKEKRFIFLLILQWEVFYNRMQIKPKIGTESTQA